MIGNPSSGEELYASTVARIAAEKSSPFFVQVGGFDGVSFDPLRRHIVERQLRGIIIEPVPCYFEKIEKLYANNPNVTAVNCAVSEQTGEAVIWRFKPEAVERGILPPHFAGISSFLMEDLLADSGVLGRSCPDEETKRILRTLVEPVPVACRTMSEILDSQGVATIDILQIDTEGYDFRILQLFNFERFKPSLVQYEHQHLNLEDRAAAEAYLARYGYQLHPQDFDTIAVLSNESITKDLTRARVLALADSLFREARSEEAVHLLRYADQCEPGRVDTLRALLSVYSAQDRVIETLETLIALRDADAEPAAILPLVQTHSLPAIALFNTQLNEGKFAEAERTVALLVRLAPQSAPFLEAVMSCNQALGAVDRSVEYARRLLQLDPGHERARLAVAAYEGDISAPSHAKAEAALNPQADLHPLLQLRDLHDAGSEILTAPLTASSIDLLDRLWSKAATLKIDVPAGSEWEGWANHYRSLVAAADSRVLRTQLAASPEPTIASVMCADGSTVHWPDVRALAAQTKAECVFFVAADETYIRLYARHFVRSIQKYSEAPCLMVVHVIGGQSRLGEIVSGLGLADERLLFTADDFDAASVRTLCHDAPPKGTSERPLAHFQSARFLHVGTILAELQLPVFVSDIDLLLQNEIRPLLTRFASADFVLNHNAESAAFGSRFTANLLLLNPRANTAAFLTTLRAYLDNALAGESVTRWIDQCGLMMAQHALRLQAPDVKIAHFDTSRDVNNVMYGSYQDHPYTFLSLYHGFDTASLEGENGAFDRPARVGNAA